VNPSRIMAPSTALSDPTRLLAMFVLGGGPLLRKDDQERSAELRLADLRPTARDARSPRRERRVTVNTLFAVTVVTLVEKNGAVVDAT
jgi:hypothetical protein